MFEGGRTVRIVFSIARVIVGVLIIAAIVAQLIQTITFEQAQGADLGFTVLNFFSFFTIDSNTASVVILLVGAVLLQVQKGKPDPFLYNTVRSSVVTYMITTGLVYNLLLRNIPLPQGLTVPWSNEILHVVAPIYLLLDWLFAPGRMPLNWKKLWVIIAFPIVWVGYTLIRGPLAINSLTDLPWYPYPFLNPATSANGYLSVAFYVILIALVIVSIGAGVIWVSRRRLHHENRMNRAQASAVLTPSSAKASS